MWIRTEMVEYSNAPWKKVVQVIFPPVFTFASQLLVDPQLAAEKDGLPADGQGVLPHLLFRGEDLLLPGGHLATIHPEVDEVFESFDINVSQISDAFQVFFVASQSAERGMTPIHSVVLWSNVHLSGVKSATVKFLIAAVRRLRAIFSSRPSLGSSTPSRASSFAASSFSKKSSGTSGKSAVFVLVSQKRLSPWNIDADALNMKIPLQMFYMMFHFTFS